MYEPRDQSKTNMTSNLMKDIILKQLADCSATTTGDEKAIKLPISGVGVILHAALSMQQEIDTLKGVFQQGVVMTPSIYDSISSVLPDLNRMGCGGDDYKCIHSPSETGRGWGGLCPLHRAVAILTAIREEISLNGRLKTP